MEEDHEKIHFQGEENATGLIDFSTEDDALVLDADCCTTAMEQTQSLENWKEFSNFDLMGSSSIDAGKEADILGSNDLLQSYPDLIKPPEPERAMRKGMCNLRKSLAWDSAFFTNAGVLDPEELSSMIGGGADKSEKHILPQIVEDVSESTDSLSTLESDTLTLDNLEVGFFEDIRASIQKSSGTIDTPSINAAPKKVDPATKNKVKQKATMEKPNMIPKVLRKHNILPRVPMKAMKQEPQDTKAAARIGVSTTTTTKASRIIGGGNPISTGIGKRASLSVATQGIKGEKGACTATKGAEAIKLPPNNGARRVLPQPASSSKSSLLSSPKMKNELSRLSSDSSKSLPPVHATISPVKAARKKLGNRIIKSPSDSTLKITTRTAPRDKTATGNSALPTCLVPSKNSSNLSSQSTERSSVSSTSASNRPRTSFDKSCRSSDHDNLPLNLDHNNSDQRFEEHENGGRALQSQQINDGSTLCGTLSLPASLKPSGLRRPSPSIGFFDGMKTVRTPKGLLQHGGIPLPSPKVASTVSCPNWEIGVKPNTKKHPTSTPIPETTLQFSDDKSADSRPPRQAEIHHTNNEFDESLMLSRQEDLVAEKEVKACASALINQCEDQKENGVSEKQVVETDKNVGLVASTKCKQLGGGQEEDAAANVFSMETLNNNNSRNPLADIKVAACSGNSQ